MSAISPQSDPMAQGRRATTLPSPERTLFKEEEEEDGAEEEEGAAKLRSINGRRRSLLSPAAASALKY